MPSWDELTEDEKYNELRAQGRPANDLSNVGSFGIRWDEAEAEGKPLGLR